MRPQARAAIIIAITKGTTTVVHAVARVITAVTAAITRKGNGKKANALIRRRENARIRKPVNALIRRIAAQLIAPTRTKAAAKTNPKSFGEVSRGVAGAVRINF